MKKTTGMVTGKHGSPWSAIDEVNEKYSSLLENVIELSDRVTDILTYVKSHEAKLKALELKKGKADGSKN
jgi:hypothetical protein